MRFEPWVHPSEKAVALREAGYTPLWRTERFSELHAVSEAARALYVLEHPWPEDDVMRALNDLRLGNLIERHNTYGRGGSMLAGEHDEEIWVPDWLAPVCHALKPPTVREAFGLVYREQLRAVIIEIAETPEHPRRAAILTVSSLMPTTGKDLFWLLHSWVFPGGAPWQ